MAKNTDKILDKAFLALGNKKRRDIITSLALQPMTISQLANLYSLSLPAIHKHLKLMEGGQLIFRKKIGRSNYMVLSNESLAEAQIWLLKHQAHWGTSKASLENYSPANFISQLSSSKKKVDKIN